MYYCINIFTFYYLIFMPNEHEFNFKLIFLFLQKCSFFFYQYAYNMFVFSFPQKTKYYTLIGLVNYNQDKKINMHRHNIYINAIVINLEFSRVL